MGVGEGGLWEKDSIIFKRAHTYFALDQWWDDFLISLNKMFSVNEHKWLIW
jgi:hypothetical protein